MQKKHNSGRQGLQLPVLVGVFLSLAILAAIPFIGIRKVEVYGNSTISREALLERSGLAGSIRWLDINTVKIRNSVLRLALVEDAQISFRFPDRLLIRIVERQAVAVVYARNRSGKMEAHCIDRTATVFAPASGYNGSENLPVLSGVEIINIEYGMKLAPAFIELATSLSEIARAEPGLSAAISELRFIARDGSLPEVLLYPAHYHLPVRLPTSFNSETVKSFLLVLDVVENGGLSDSISELDFRTDTYVLKTKEAVSG